MALERCDLLGLEKSLRALTEQLGRLEHNGVLEHVLRAIDGDGHAFGARPCATCGFVTAVRGKPFGCVRMAEASRKR